METAGERKLNKFTLINTKQIDVALYLVGIYRAKLYNQFDNIYTDKVKGVLIWVKRLKLFLDRLDKIELKIKEIEQNNQSILKEEIRKIFCCSLKEYRIMM